MQQLTYINLRGERAVFGRGAPYLLRSVRGGGACDNALTLTEDGARDGGRLLSLRREAREAFRPDAPFSIAGSDIDPEALTLCGRHIRQAGLEGRVRVHRQDLKTLTLEGPAGVFLLNPPYGERLSDREGARALYRELGLLIRRHPGWRL